MEHEPKQDPILGSGITRQAHSYPFLLNPEVRGVAVKGPSR